MRKVRIEEVLTPVKSHVVLEAMVLIILWSHDKKRQCWKLFGRTEGTCSMGNTFAKLREIALDGTTRRRINRKVPGGRS